MALMDPNVIRILEVTTNDPTELHYSAVVDHFIENGSLVDSVRIVFDKKTNRWSGKLGILFGNELADEMVTPIRVMIDEKEVLITESNAWPKSGLEKLFRTLTVETTKDQKNLSYSDAIDYLAIYGPINEVIVAFFNNKWKLFFIVFEFEEIISEVIKVPTIKTINGEKVVMHRRVLMNIKERALEVRVKNPHELSYSDIANYFSKFGRIDDVFDKNNGYFFVVFQAIEPVEALLKSPTIKIKGKEVSIKTSSSATDRCMFRRAPGEAELHVDVMHVQLPSSAIILSPSRSLRGEISHNTNGTRGLGESQNK